MAPSSESGAPAQRDAPNMSELRAEALDVLSDAMCWQVSEARWGEITRALEAMVAALEGGDAAALAVATVDLELAGPLRITPIGPAIGPTSAVRDLLNELVHSLGDVTPRRPDGSGEAGAGDADASSS
jgi:hypothetical protein